MKSRTLLIVLSFSLLFAFALPRSASAIWILDGGIEDTELDRVDSAPHSPYHEVDAGRYGFWNEVSEFVVVLDFDLGGPQSPYSWTEIYWEPGTMDWDAQSSTVEFDNLCFLSEPDFGLQLISSSGSQDSPGVTLLVAPVSDLWREEC